MKNGICFGVLTMAILGVVLGACSSDSGTCSPRTVTVDAGMDGLPDVGEQGNKELCRVVCGYQPDQCRRVKELTFTCTTACE